MVMPDPDLSAVSCRIYFKPIDTAKRLDELELREATLIRAAMTGLQYWLDATEHSCKTALGMIIWNYATQSLRDLLVPQGWSTDRTRNYEITISPSTSHAVTVSSGDKYTGDKDHTPCTSGEKGQCTKDAIEHNLQLSFAQVSPIEFPPSVEDTLQTWVLLYKIDTKREEVHLELSLPAGLNADDHINRWYERIILTAQPFGAVPAANQPFGTPNQPLSPVPATGEKKGDDDSGEIDFDIERKTV